MLAAAGLLHHRYAATHWNAREFLAAFGVDVVAERVVFDLPFITGGGVTAGIDFALALVAEIFSEAEARKIQLGLEYDPQPPFNAGSPDKAGSQIVRAYREASVDALEERRAAVQRSLINQRNIELK